MGYDVIEAQTFWDCVSSLNDDPFKAQLLDTMVELRRQPFHNPKLATHDVGKAKNGKVVLSSDVGGRRTDRRLVWQMINNTIVVLLYGTHAVQERAKRMRIDFDPAEKVVTVYEQAPSEEIERPYQQHRREVGRAFMAWTDADLAGFGFTEPVIDVLRGLDDQNALLDLEDDLPSGVFERAFNLLAYGHPEGELAAHARTNEEERATVAEPPEPTAGDEELEEQLRDPRASAWFTRLGIEEVEEIMARPIEDWMVFLHPDQRSVAERTYSGPARVRGSAGTGKTVVVLHRAAVLAQRYAPEASEDGGRILVTTFIKSLPPVLDQLYRRLHTARPELVDFTNVDKLANRICREAGQAPTLDPRGVDAARAAAWRKVNVAGSALQRLGITEHYAGEEVSAVIKGRAIDDLDTYLATKRTGRRLQLPEGARREIWDFAQAWQEGLTQRGVVDFPDVVRRARDLARARTEPTYRAALIDEAQDLTLVGLQLVRALVNGGQPDRPDGLFLAGDGAQRIYPGGFNLRQAGIQVRGRTTVLKVNYRNTAEILHAALAVAGGEGVEDLDEQFTRAGDAGDTLRHGPRPVLVVADTDAEQIDLVAGTIEKLVAESGNGIGSGDVGVLCPSNKLAEAVRAGLARHHIPTIDLNKYEGLETEAVKVGTHHRVKGLEFKAVILTDLTDGVFPRPRPASVTAEEWADQQATSTAALFVAMTRARDRLVITCVGHPSPVLGDAIDRLDVMDSVGGDVTV